MLFVPTISVILVLGIMSFLVLLTAFLKHLISQERKITTCEMRYLRKAFNKTRRGEWATPWTQPLIIILPMKGNIQLCQNYHTISLISHPSKVMLRILNRLKPQAEEIIKEEQAGFEEERSTTEQIFNFRILCDKYLQHQHSLYHDFVDFKKAFDRV